MNTTSEAESRDGVPLTNLDQALFDGAGATKRHLVEYLDAVRDRILPVLEHMPEPRPLSPDLIKEGHAIPVARVQAMHEGKRRAREARDAAAD